MSFFRRNPKLSPAALPAGQLVMIKSLGNYGKVLDGPDALNEYRVSTDGGYDTFARRDLAVH